MKFLLYKETVISFSYCIPFPRIETQLFTYHAEVQTGKSASNITFKSKNAESSWKKSTFPFISPFRGLVFSIFRRQKYGPKQQKTDIKVPIPALIQ